MSTVPRPQPQLYTLIVENSDEAIIALDPQQRISLFNPAAQAMTRLSEKTCLGQLFRRCFQDQPELCLLVETALRAGRSMSEHTGFRLGELATPLPIRASVSPLFDQNGGQQGAVLMMRDLTQIHALEETVRRAERLSMVGTMVAGLAHEIKNPLGGIRGAAQLLKMELGADHPLIEYPQVMIRETDRVNDLIEELLGLSHSKVELHHQVNLARILDETLLLQRQAFATKQVDFALSLDPSIPPLQGDPKLLAQLFLNLIKNAGEAVAPKGKVWVSTRIDADYHLGPSGGRRIPLVKVLIEDNGPGISAEERKHLFTPFYTTKQGGTGLGLATCQKIVNDHQGLINLSAHSSGGCSFAVSLPLFRC